MANGQKVEAEQAIAEMESSKTNFEVYAPVAGVIRYTHVEGIEIDVGGVLCNIEHDGRAVTMPSCITETLAVAQPSGPPAQIPSVTIPQAIPPDRTPPTPVHANGASTAARFSKEALQVLRQRGLDPEQFADRGLVRVIDLGNGSENPRPHEPPHDSPTDKLKRPTVEAVRPMAAQGVSFRPQAQSRAKLAEIRYLQTAHQTTLPSMVSVAVPTRGLRATAERHAHVQANASAILLFDVARILREYPFFNGFYAAEKANYYEEVNIGFAIDAGRGLKVPVIRNADQKTFPEIAAEMQNLLVQYLNDEIPLSALAGGTFTISDLSGEGVFQFLPVLNQGQSAILGVGAEFFPPGCKEGVFNLMLTFDHQISEGRQAARFLNELSKRLQSYEDFFGSGRDTTPSDSELFCSECMRPIAELRFLDAFLIPTVNSDQSQRLVCNLCLEGWR